MNRKLKLAACVCLAILPGAVLAAGREKTEPVFQTADRCMACHNGLLKPTGEDMSIGFDWRPTMMANAARDPYWQAGVRREITDHPESRAAIEGECSICHMPMARYESKAAGREGHVFAHLPVNAETTANRFAADGASCSVCHQISTEKLGTRESLVGNFVIAGPNDDGSRKAYGPFEVDSGRARIMRSSSGFRPTAAKHIRSSELCATCHTLITHALGAGGKVIGELPEQVPYQEWEHSSYRDTASCQSCHMPVVKEAVPIAAVMGQPREGVSVHTFLGGNFLMQRILSRFRDALGSAALPQEFDQASMRTIAHLKQEAAAVSIEKLETESGRLVAEILVRNRGGHKLPTAYPSRRAWLHVTVRDAGGKTVFESGAFTPSGAIAGNDNDADAARFEPHYTEISNAAQVQIYEDIMVDSAGAVTTGLLHGIRFVKDNRLLPAGFDKRTADKEVAVHGGAADVLAQRRYDRAYLRHIV